MLGNNNHFFHACVVYVRFKTTNIVRGKKEKTFDKFVCIQSNITSQPIFLVPIIEYARICSWTNVICKLNMEKAINDIFI